MIERTRGPRGLSSKASQSCFVQNHIFVLFGSFKLFFHFISIIFRSLRRHSSHHSRHHGSRDYRNNTTSSTNTSPHKHSRQSTPKNMSSRKSNGHDDESPRLQTLLYEDGSLSNVRDIQEEEMCTPSRSLSGSHGHADNRKRSSRYI